MIKHIAIVQNTEIGGHLALSVFLTNLLRNYEISEEKSYSLICGSVIPGKQIEKIQASFDIHTTNTNLYKIKDNFLFAWRSFLELRKIHKEKHIDIVHCFYPNSSVLGAILFRVFCSWKTPILYDIRSPWIEMSFSNAHISSKMRAIRYIMHLSEFIATRFVRYFVFITHGTKNYYINQYNIRLDGDNSSIIPSGVDVEKFGKGISATRRTEILGEIGAQGDEILIGYVGTIAYIRKLDEFLVKNSHWISLNNCKIIYIGDGDAIDSLKVISKEQGIENKIIFLGKKSPESVPEYIHIFDYGLCHLPDIFVFQNSYPLKVLEYLSAGKKVICSDINAHREIQKEFQDELLIYRDTLTELSLEKQAEKTNPNEKIHRYSWGYLAEEYQKVYNTIH